MTHASLEPRGQSPPTRPTTHPPPKHPPATSPPPLTPPPHHHTTSTPTPQEHPSTLHTRAPRPAPTHPPMSNESWNLHTASSLDHKKTSSNLPAPSEQEAKRIEHQASTVKFQVYRYSDEVVMSSSGSRVAGMRLRQGMSEA